MKVSAYHLCVVALILAPFANAQRPHTTEAPGRLEVAKHPLVLEPAAGPQTPRIDPTKLEAEAMEMAALAQSVRADVEQVANGKLPKDLTDKLKRIEKLAKHLRGELTP